MVRHFANFNQKSVCTTRVVEKAVLQMRGLHAINPFVVGTVLTALTLLYEALTQTVAFDDPQRRAVQVLNLTKSVEVLIVVCYLIATWYVAIAVVYPVVTYQYKVKRRTKYAAWYTCVVRHVIRYPLYVIVLTALHVYVYYYNLFEDALVQYMYHMYKLQYVNTFSLMSIVITVTVEVYRWATNSFDTNPYENENKDEGEDGYKRLFLDYITTNNNRLFYDQDSHEPYTIGPYTYNPTVIARPEYNERRNTVWYYMASLTVACVLLCTCMTMLSFENLYVTELTDADTLALNTRSYRIFLFYCCLLLAVCGIGIHSNLIHAIELMILKFDLTKLALTYRDRYRDRLVVHTRLYETVWPTLSWLTVAYMIFFRIYTHVVFDTELERVCTESALACNIYIAVRLTLQIAFVMFNVVTYALIREWREFTQTTLHCESDWIHEADYEIVIEHMYALITYVIIMAVKICLEA